MPKFVLSSLSFVLGLHFEPLLFLHTLKMGTDPDVFRSTSLLLYIYFLPLCSLSFIMLSEVGGLKSFSKPTLETTYTRKTFFFFFFNSYFVLTSF